MSVCVCVCVYFMVHYNNYFFPLEVSRGTECGGGWKSTFTHFKFPCVNPSPKIVINLHWTCKNLHCKGEPNRFSGYWDPSVHTDILLLLHQDENSNLGMDQREIQLHVNHNERILDKNDFLQCGVECLLLLAEM